MAHEITKTDRVGLLGKQAWHHLGVVIEDELGAVEAAERFGLTWPVAQWNLEAVGPNGQRIEVPTHVANVRTADQDGNQIEHLLGVVGDGYAICQNRELAEFTDALAQAGSDVVIETCGSIRGGKRVWFLARGNAFEIGTVEDKVAPYLLVSNAHDGTGAIRITPTSVRVVCSNTLHLVVPQAEDKLSRPESAAYVIRHTGKISDKLGQARNALKHYQQTLNRNRELFEALKDTQVSREKAIETFATVYAANWEVATDDELASKDEKVKRTAENRLNRMNKAVTTFLKRYDAEAETVGHRDNGWSLLNGITGYIQHDVTARGKDDAARAERRMESNLFGLNASRTHEALAECLALAG